MRFSKPEPTRRQRPEASGRSTGVYSYYNAPVEKVIDLSAQKPKHVRLLPSIIAIIVIIISILGNLTLSTKPYVQTATGEDSPYRSMQAYEEEAAKILGESFNNQTKLTIQTGQITEALLKRFPEVKSLSLRLPLIGRRITMTVQLREPALVLTSQAASYVIDSSGRAVSLLQDISSDVRKDLIVIKDESGLDLSVGDQALPSEAIDFVKTMTAQLDAQGMKVTQLTFPLSANQLDVRIEGLNYYIKTDVTGEARVQVGRFLAVKERLDKERVTPSEYIDVRVEDKVFYK